MDGESSVDRYPFIIKSAMKTIGIDCRLAGKKHAGIGRYIEELVTRITLEPSINWVLFLHDADQLTLPKLPNVRTVLAPVRHYSLQEQLQMPGIFAKEKLDLLHVPHFNVPLLYRGKTVITIHDLLWHTQSNASATTLSPLIHAIKYAFYKIITAHAVKSALSILVPAQTVKNEILQFYPTLAPDKISVTLEGVGDVYREHTETASSTPEKILFYTGSLYPHKNVITVVEALKSLPDYQLYLSSSRSVFVDEFLSTVNSLDLASRVHHLGRLDDQDLLHWYDKSMALVQPSTAEGFGLTGLEAMAAGLPVIASDIPIFHEIYGDAYVPFAPSDPASFVRALHTLESGSRSARIQAGRAQANLYSWDKMVDQTLALYQQHV